MKHRSPLTLLAMFAVLIVTLALPPAAAAQGVWRCGADGRSYSSTPCANGQQLESIDPRPAADLTQAQQRAAQERKTADALTRERLALEAAQRGNGLGGITAARPLAVKPAASRAQPRAKKHHRPAEDDGTWRAVAPSSRRAKG